MAPIWVEKWKISLSQPSKSQLFLCVDIAHDNAALKDLDENWEKIAPLLLNYNYTIAETEQKNISAKIRKDYFGDKHIDSDSLPDLVHVVGDRLFIADAIRAATLQAKANKNPVWFYYYNFKATKKHKNGLDLGKNSLKISSPFLINFLWKSYFVGVAHGDDFCLLFDNEHIPEPVTQEDKNMQKVLLDLVTSFMNKG